ncbi:hypothetical protein ABW21_db0206015 [Orbilia brochopaga]|nr:hypothetical protein ABW21_db0206015 [Drechslerella brochopaga]
MGNRAFNWLLLRINMPGKTSSSRSRSSKKSSSKHRDGLIDKIKKKIRSMRDNRAERRRAQRQASRRASSISHQARAPVKPMVQIEPMIQTTPSPTSPASSEELTPPSPTQSDSSDELETQVPEDVVMVEITASRTPSVRSETLETPAPEDVVMEDTPPTDGAASEHDSVQTIEATDYIEAHPPFADEGFDDSPLETPASGSQEGTKASSVDTESDPELTVTTPFKLWWEIIDAVAEIGVPDDEIDEDVYNTFGEYADDEPESAIWCDDHAVALFTRERDAYDAAIAYMRCAVEEAPYPRWQKQRQAWHELADLDFRLNAVVNNLKKTIDQVMKEKEKCYWDVDKRTNGAVLIRALHQTLGNVKTLRQAIFAMLKKLRDEFHCEEQLRFF